MHSFLEAHRLQPDRRGGSGSSDDAFSLWRGDANQQVIFNLGLSRPLSIRDQFVRATTVVHLLIEGGVLAREHNLLIVGGGVSGVAAALARYHHQPANQRDAPALGHTKIFDGGETLIQRRNERRIDPTLYRWPGWGWDLELELGFGNDLRWPIDSMWSSVADSWVRAFHRARASHNTLAAHTRCHVHTSAELRPQDAPEAAGYVVQLRLHRRDGRLCGVKLQSATNPKPREKEKFNEHFARRHPPPPPTWDAQVVLLCGGPGKEKVWPSDNDAQETAEPVPKSQFRGFEFWQEGDPLVLGHGFRGEPKNVVISGGGDGALQDFIRFMTGQHPREVLNRLLPKESSQRSAVALRVQRIEDHYQRQYTWLAPTASEAKGRHCKDLMGPWDQDYERLVQQLDLDLGPLEALIEANENRPTRVDLVFSCDHYGWCYALNRFLAWALRRVVVESREPRVELCIHRGRTVWSVEPEPESSHERCQAARSCSGEPHRVVLTPKRCGTKPVQPSPTPPAEDVLHANYVIIRHGVQPAQPLFGDRASTFVPRMMFPLDRLGVGPLVTPLEAPPAPSASPGPADE